MFLNPPAGSKHLQFIVIFITRPRLTFHSNVIPRFIPLPPAPSPPERGERTGRYFQPLRTLLLPRFSHGRPCVEIRAPARENARKYDLVKYRGERDNGIFHAPNASSMLTRYLAPHKRSSVVCGLLKKREKKRGTVFLSRIYRLFIFCLSIILSLFFLFFNSRDD